LVVLFPCVNQLALALAANASNLIGKPENWLSKQKTQTTNAAWVITTNLAD
jgi:hypothetical protein